MTYLWSRLYRRGKRNLAGSIETLRQHAPRLPQSFSFFYCRHQRWTTSWSLWLALSSASLVTALSLSNYRSRQQPPLFGKEQYQTTTSTVLWSKRSSPYNSNGFLEKGETRDRPTARSFGLNPMSHRRLCHCEMAAGAQPEPVWNNNRDEEKHDDDVCWLTDSNHTYRLMPLPDRSLKDTHAIFGTLIRNQQQYADQSAAIESYHVYQRVGRHIDPSHPINDPNNATISSPVVIGVVRLGTAVDGHAGVVHGGILALLMDDVLGFAYEAVDDPKVPHAVTANLNINYKAPVPAGSAVHIRAILVERQERKMIWNVTVVSPPSPYSDNQLDVIYCEATSVFVIPRHVYEKMNEARENQESS